MTRRYDPRRARAHRNYSRVELCELFNVRLPTISSWVGKGLQPIDNRRPYVFSGLVVREFLTKHNKPRHPTGPGQLFCVACKLVVEPAGGTVLFRQLNETNGDFIGNCPTCVHRIHQRVRIADIEKKKGNLTVVYEDAAATICESGRPPHSKSNSGSMS